MTLPSVSVVVVNWNGKHHLTACLKALLRQSYKGKLDLVLMDNGSTDGSEAFVQQAFPTVRVIQSPENLGFGTVAPHRKTGRPFGAIHRVDQRHALGD